MLKISKFKKLVVMVIVFSLVLSFALPSRMSDIFAHTALNAETAMDDFIDAFYDPSEKYFYTNSDRQIHEHAPGPENGLYTDYWWEAQIWQMIMDAYERTGKIYYFNLIGDIYDGFDEAYPDWANNPYNDDILWWSFGAIRAYEITGDTKYKVRAKEMFDHVWQSWSSDFGGGIWWNTLNHLPQKNVATNVTATIVAIRLYNAYNDVSYLDKAHSLYNWAETTLYEGNGYINDQYRQNVGVVDWEFTYNFGGFAGASLELYKVTDDSQYLVKATDCVDWVFENMTVDGSTLLYEGMDDLPTFKMIFARNVKRLIEEANQTQYISLLQENATQAWNHRRVSDGLIGLDWSLFQDDGFIQSIASAAGVDILFLSSPDDFTGIVTGLGVYEAENARHYGVSNEMNEYENQGYSARGYVAGWNQNNTSIVFPVNVQSTGEYTLTFYYSAAAGNAVRELKTNGTTTRNVNFNQTPTWSDWTTLSFNVSLVAGANRIELVYNGGKGSLNYLNLDKLTVVYSPFYEAENATLHNLGVESQYMGYTGTGYVAGWNQDGQWLDFNIETTAAGYYNLIFRYSGGAGMASRYLYVNENGVIDNQIFSGTGNWSNYETVEISNIYLQNGNNVISLIYNSSKGSANWVNIDHLQVKQ